jgi:hypothetical protein
MKKNDSFGSKKTKPIQSLWLEILNKPDPGAPGERDLKKQSQFTVCTNGRKYL